MAMHSELDSWRSLSMAEKLLVVQELWEDIRQSDEEMPHQAWHRQVAEQRAAELDANPSIAITHDEFLTKIGYRNE